MAIVTPDPQKTKEEELADEIHNTLMTASFQYEIWWFCNNPEHRPQILQVLNQYSHFFQPSINACFTAAIVAIYQVLEKRSDTVNFRTLLAALKGKGVLDTAAARHIEASIKSIRPVWKKVALLRSNVIAHRNSKLSVADLYKKAAITPNEITDLLEQEKGILNAISGAAWRSSYAFNLSAIEDVRQLIADLETLER